MGIKLPDSFNRLATATTEKPRGKLRVAPAFGLKWDKFLFSMDQGEYIRPVNGAESVTECHIRSAGNSRALELRNRSTGFPNSAADGGDSVINGRLERNGSDWKIGSMPSGTFVIIVNPDDPSSTGDQNIFSHSDYPGGHRLYLILKNDLFYIRMGSGSTDVIGPARKGRNVVAFTWSGGTTKVVSINAAGVSEYTYSYIGTPGSTAHLSTVGGYREYDFNVNAFDGRIELIGLDSHNITEAELHSLALDPWQVVTRAEPVRMLFSNGGDYAAVIKDASINFDVLNAVHIERQVLFNALTTAAKEAGVGFDVLNSVSAERSALWDVLNAITKDVSILASVLNSTSLDATIKFNILNAINKDAALNWNVESSFISVYQDAAISFDVFNSVKNDAVIAFNALAAVHKESSVLFDVLNSIGSDADFSWDVLNAVAQDAALSWSVEGLGSVYKDASISWEVLNILGKEAILRWSVQGVGVTPDFENLITINSATKQFRITSVTKKYTIN